MTIEKTMKTYEKISFWFSPPLTIQNIWISIYAAKSEVEMNKKEQEIDDLKKT